MRKNRVLILALALVLLFGVSVGGTLAWLLDDTDPVVNTFTDSDISITLEETDTKKDSDDDPNTNQYQMIPGWTIDKDPKVTVVADSEDCWLFVKLEKAGGCTVTNPDNTSTTYDFDDFITYAVILDNPTTTDVVEGWTQLTKDKDGNEITDLVYYRKVYKDDTTKEFGIIGYTDASDNFVADKVLVKDTVTKEMMNAFDVDEDGALSETEQNALPKLTFQAYAVQLFKTNSDGDKNTTTDEFTAAEAWEKAAAMG